MPPTVTARPARRDPWERRLDAWVFRNRTWLGPPAIAGTLVVATAVVHALGRWWPSGPVWLAVLAGVVLVLGLTSAADLPLRDRSGWRRWEERLFGGACWAVGCGWTATAAWWGPTPGLLLALAAAGTPLAVLWSRHRRVRRGVAVDREIAAWGDGSPVGLPGTTARPLDAGEDWFSFRLSADVAGQYTLDDYRRAARRIAARQEVPADNVVVERAPDGGEGTADVTVRQAARQTVAFEAGSSAEPISIVGAHPVGRRDNGQPLEVALFLPGRGAQHGVAVGASGSGKSGLANRIITQLVRAEEALALLVDFSPGAQELRGWAPAAHAFITTAEDMDRLVIALLALCEYRGRTSTGRLITPSKTVKLPGVIMDEAATYFAPELLGADATGLDVAKARRLATERAARSEQGVRLYRKYAVSKWMLTQYGEAPAVGGTTARDQLTGNGYAFAFHSPKNVSGHLVIPATHGLQVSEIPRSAPGTCGALGPTWDGLAKGRVEYMTDTDIAEVAAEWADRQGDLLPAEISAMDRATDGWWSARPRTAPGGGTRPAAAPTAPAGPAPVAPVQGRRRMGSAEESQELVWQTLASFPAGARRSEVAEKCGKSADLVGARLAELADVGRAERPAHPRGRWKALSGPV